MDWSFPFWSSVLGVIGIVLAVVIARWTIRASTRSAQEATQKTLDAQRQSDLAAMLSELTGITRHEGSRSKRLKRSPETAARWDSVIARLWFSGVDGASSVSTWLRQVDEAWVKNDIKAMRHLLGNDRVTMEDPPQWIELRLQDWFVSPDYAVNFEEHTIPEPHYSCPD